ncbi:MAG: glutathione S-transferase, partial [Pusillimonas sp.]|nr:glutathione S-transferase [Pusillimonas sp.]
MIDSLPILYSFRRCPYAMRARLAVAASGLQCQLREVVLRNKPQAMLQASPKGTVPVLVLTDGKVIDESLDIMLWALRQNDPD